jgi:hypothetical protein
MTAIPRGLVTTTFSGAALPEPQQLGKIVLVAAVTARDEVPPGTAVMMDRRRVDASWQRCVAHETFRQDYGSCSVVASFDHGIHRIVSLVLPYTR